MKRLRASFAIDGGFTSSNGFEGISLLRTAARKNCFAHLTDLPAVASAITIGKDEGVYAIRPIPADFGVAFRLIKGELVEEPDNTLRLRDAAHYDVCLNGAQSTCECKGFLRHSHCKHVDGLTTLCQRNLI